MPERLECVVLQKERYMNTLISTRPVHNAVESAGLGKMYFDGSLKSSWIKSQIMSIKVLMWMIYIFGSGKGVR